MEPPVAATRRLGVGHLLVWMAGCGVVLAIFRSMPDFSQMTAEEALETRLVHLGIGLGYGTALSGLAYFLWNRWRGVQHRPTQPGHWMLVLGGIGLAVNLLAAGVAHQATPLLHQASVYLDEWTLFQALGWVGAFAVGAVTMIRVRGTGRWRLVAWLLLALLLVGSAAYGVSLAGQIGRVPGSWHWIIPFYVRLAALPTGILAILAADVADRLEGRQRDWMHGAGVAAVVGMAGIDLAVTIRYVLTM